MDICCYNHSFSHSFLVCIITCFIKNFYDYFLAVIVALAYSRTHNSDYKLSEKDLYEEEVGKKIKKFFEGFDSNELWLKSDKEIYPLLCAEFEKNRENYKYNMIMKKHN